LYGGGSIIAHNELMTFVVDGLMFTCAFWEGAYAPVGDGADCASGGEDEGAGCAGDAAVSVSNWKGMGVEDYGDKKGSNSEVGSS
jgi:hypothetical protein